MAAKRLRVRTPKPSGDGALFTRDEIEFMLAMEAYMRDNRRPFPNSGEVLDVAKALGYRKAKLSALHRDGSR